MTSTRWEPIETATLGEHGLLWYTGAQIPVIGRVYQYIRGEKVGKRGASASSREVDEALAGVEFTHWMPLPRTPDEEPCRVLGWLLIETAPKDGSLITIGLLASSGKFWTADKQWWISSDEEQGGRWSLDPMWGEGSPTHWRPGA